MVSPRPLGLKNALLMLCLPACGGTAVPVVEPPTGLQVPVSAAPASVASTDVDVWAGLLKGGGRFELHGGEGQVLIATVRDARRLGKHDLARIDWKMGTDAQVGPPSQVAADADAIYLLDASLEDADVQDALGVPSPWPRRSRPVWPMSRLDGAYAQVWQSATETVVCYGEGPPPDAPPCENVCFAELCLSDRAGIVEIGGTWAPNFDAFAAPTHSKFRETMEFKAAPAVR